MRNNPYSVIMENPSYPFLLLCEHASPHIPQEYENLGISQETIHSHYGWDIGALDVFKEILSLLKVSGIYSKISRLVIDSNRKTGAKDLIREELDPGQIIPGNYQISEEEKKHRIETYWKPFHGALEDCIGSYLKRGIRPFLVSVHSFTPIFGDEDRDLDLGLLFQPQIVKVNSMVLEIKENLEKEGYRVELNKPYSVENPKPYPIHHYSEKYDLLYLAIEINNELINTHSQASKVGSHLADCLACI